MIETGSEKVIKTFGIFTDTTGVERIGFATLKPEHVLDLITGNKTQGHIMQAAKTKQQVTDYK